MSDADNENEQIGVASRISLWNKVTSHKGWITRLVNQVNDTMDEDVDSKQRRISIRQLQEKIYHHHTSANELLFQLMKIDDKSADKWEQELQKGATSIEQLEEAVNEWILEQRAGGSMTSRQSVKSTGESNDVYFKDKAIGVSNTPPPSSCDTIKLEALSVPRFNGNDYFSWRSVFDIVVHKQPMSEGSKMLRLVNCLEGEAKVIISSYPPIGSAYNLALQRLEDEYGGTSRLIREAISSIRNGKVIDCYDIKRIRMFVGSLDNAIIILNDNDLQSELGCGTLLECAKERLTKEFLSKFVMNLSSLSKKASLIALRDFLRDHLRILCEVGYSEKRSIVNTISTVSNDTRSANSLDNKAWKPCCPIHGKKDPDTHYLDKCPDFIKMNVLDRLRMVKDKKLCNNCLKTNHFAKDCRRAKENACRICKGSHHSLLHRDVQTDGNISLGFSQEIEQTSYVAMLSVPALLSANGKSIEVNVLLDSGSNMSFINNDVAEFLQVNKTEGVSQMITMLNGNTQTICPEVVTVNLSNKNGSNRRKIALNVVERVTGTTPVVDWNKLKMQFGEEVKFERLSSKRLIHDVLLGTDHAFFHSSLKDVVCVNGAVARLTPLGWTAMGYTGAMNESKCAHFLNQNVKSKDDDLKVLIEKFWERDDDNKNEKNIEKPKTSAELVAISKLSSGLQLNDGRYTAPILWRNDCPPVINNYESAKKRLQQLEHKFIRDPLFKEKYENIINDYVEKGFVSLVPNESVKDPNSWYIPHFAVPKGGSSAIRVVFDGSAKYRGFSLNDCILSGPKEHADLFRVLLRFRQWRVAVVGDIEAMYLQILNEPKDTPYCRFLWREDVYEWKRLWFGRRDAPYIAIKCLKMHASDNKEEFPSASESVLKSTYVDDIIDSRDSEIEALNLKDQLSNMFQLAGMNVTKWSSNQLGIANFAEGFDFDRHRIQEKKTLGIFWWNNEDYLSFQRKEYGEVTPWTKREVLRITASIYDPLGMVEPIVIRAKTFLQLLWTANIDWDEPLHDSMLETWFPIFNQLKLLFLIKIPRHIGMCRSGKSALHIFGDASIHAYGAVAYMMTESSEEVKCNFVCARSRVSPMKAQSIPRLELMGAVLSVRLACKICNTYDMSSKLDVTFWSDSTAVLAWILQPAKFFNAFVSNRVSEIQESTDPIQWRYVPSKENPSDVLTRGSDSSELSTNKLWLHGPSYLTSPKEKWPKVYELKLKQEVLDVEHRKDAKLCLSTISCSPMEDTFPLNPSKWSSWTKLLKRMSFVFSAIGRFKGEITPKNENVDKAERFLIKCAQMKSFAKEYGQLQRRSSIEKSSSIFKLNVFLDEHGLLRSGTRLAYAEWLPKDTRYPILLPKDQHVTRLLIGHFHETVGHCVGTNAVIHELNKKFWVINVRQQVKKYGRQCAKCIKKNSRVMVPKMAPIPKFRLDSPYFAFSKVGIDFAGPFLVKIGRGQARHKRYVCLYTCLQSRAIHLEICNSLETQSFLNCFSRFIDRRGVPSECITDNGRTFVRAEKELNSLFKKIDWDNVAYKYQWSMKWRFNPPYGAHFGGVFERLVKSFKKALYVTLPDCSVTDEEFLTVVCGCERLLNSRPLSPCSVDLEDCSALTPNHFIIGRNNLDIFSGGVEETAHPTRRWRYIQTLLNHVWQRWRSELIVQWRSRCKWNDERYNMKVGDLVISIEPNTPRNSWKICRVVKVHPGEDGIVRVTTISKMGTTRVRPVSQLIPLEFGEYGPKFVGENVTNHGEATTRQT